MTLKTIQGADTFDALSTLDQVQALRNRPADEQRYLLRSLDPDDAADLLQQFETTERETLLGLLDVTARSEVKALLAYAEDVAGGLMNPRYLRARSHLTVQEAIAYVRRQVAGNVGTASYIYVLDTDQKLLGVLSMRELFVAPADRTVASIMHTKLVTVSDQCPQEQVSNVFVGVKLMCIPVVDAQGRMKGIVSADDIVGVVQREATEDIQKLGGSEALSKPYLTERLSTVIGKRGIWLIVLFVGELLTASAMAHYEDAIAKAVVLALFVPLIISSGGNAGSQASTLVIRAMALGEVKLSDWWRVARRELVVGLSLGAILAVVGIARVMLWQTAFGSYGEHALLIALTLGVSLVGVVLWGSLSGSLLPFLLRRCGFDPATASTPFVATLVDVTGLVIYFSVASVVLMGKLL